MLKFKYIFALTMSLIAQTCFADYNYNLFIKSPLDSITVKPTALDNCTRNAISGGFTLTPSDQPFVWTVSSGCNGGSGASLQLDIYQNDVKCGSTTALAATVSSVAPKIYISNWGNNLTCKISVYPTIQGATTGTLNITQ
jgi:hypothetical protein